MGQGEQGPQKSLPVLEDKESSVFWTEYRWANSMDMTKS